MFNKKYQNTFRSLLGIKGALLVFLLCIGIASCKKSQSDVDALQAKFASGMVSFVEGGNVVALNGTNYSFTPYYVGVPVSLTEKATTNDTATATVDPSLVAQYNQIYLEKNLSIPQNAFQVSHQGAFPMASGSTQAKDSLYVVLNDGSQLKDSTVYLVPVTLSAKKSSKLKYSLYFFKVFVTKSDLKAKMFGAGAVNGSTPGRVTGGALNLVYSGAATPDSLKMRVTITTLFPIHDVYVQATLLTDAEVNSAITSQGFTGTPMPAGFAGLGKDVVTVPARSLLSRDSLTFRILNKANIPKNQWLVTGVKIKTYTASPYGVPPVANDSCRAYIRYFIY